MSDPDKNDDWADLLQELGVEGSLSAKPQAAVAPQPLPVEESSEEEPFGFEPLSESESAEDSDDDSESDEDGEEGAEGSDESSPDDPNKKKRRRRRRRRKKGAPGSPEEAAENAAAPVDEEAEEEVVVAQVAPETLGVDEITPEATREMIAKWNVPSWSELVAGLYRPER